MYKFDSSKIAEAHEWNQGRVGLAVAGGVGDVGDVVVDNTNVFAWEARPYVELALRFGLSVVFVRVDGGFVNTHGVPQRVVDRMRANLECLSVEVCLRVVRPVK